MKGFLSLFVVDKTEYAKVNEKIWQENWHGFMFYSWIAFFGFGAMTIASLWVPTIYDHTALYGGYCLLQFIFGCLSRRKNNSITEKKLLIYSFYIVLLSFGMQKGILVDPLNSTASYAVLMMAVPLLFTAKACVLNSMILCTTAIYALLAYATQTELIFLRSMLILVPYSALSMFVIAVIMRNKIQGLLYYIEVEELQKAEKEAQKKINKYADFITDMVRYSASEEKPDKVIEQLLAYIGDKLESDRAYIFEENSRGSFDNTYEWCKAGVTRQIDNLQDVPYEGVIETWYQQYKSAQTIIIEDIEIYKGVSEAIYQLLKPQGVTTLVTGPLIINGKMIGFYGVDNPPARLLDDISELIVIMEFIVSFMIKLRDNANSLEYSAYHDQMTGCKNRKALEWMYQKEYAEDETLAVMMCDLNGLKEVNDKEGHDAGDRFITGTAAVLKAVFGAENVYRMGGDEFAVVLLNIAKEEFDKKVEQAHLQLGTTASLGGVYKEKIDTEIETIFKCADQLMYTKKSEYYNTNKNNRRK